MSTKESRAHDAVQAANALALNLVHFIDSGGIGQAFVMDALQCYEDARARFCGFPEGFRYTDHLRESFHRAGAALRHDPNVQEWKEARP